MATTNFPYGITSFGGSVLNKVAIGVVGQSNEQGRVDPSDLAAYPQCFASLTNPSFNSPVWGQILPGYGGFWHKVYDDLAAQGYEAKIFNGAVGSSSFVTATCGQVLTRANSSGVAARRSPDDFEDRGYFGATTVQGGKVFVATTAKKQVAFRRKNIFGATSWAESGIDFISTSGTGTTAASDPGGWSAAALGGTITDGTVTWTCVDTTNSTGMSNGQVLSPTFSAYGFDPFGILERVHINMSNIRASQKIIYIQNAQSDAGTPAATYQSALENIATFFLIRGYKVVIGLSCFNPNTTTANYNLLATGRLAAIASLQAGAYGAKVFAGANLYDLMGSTGNMALGGAWLQSDNVHLNGAGALVGAGYISPTILSALS